jgi:rhamnosyltransferase subunit B
MHKPRKFVLVPVGSLGDVLPFIWLAQGLREAGHEVVSIVHSRFFSLYHTAHLPAICYGTAEDYDTWIHHPDLWHPRRCFALLTRMIEPWHRHALPHLRKVIVPGSTTLVAPALAFAARIAAEVHQVPLVTVQLQPATFFSIDSPPILRAGWERFPTCPRWIIKLAYRIVYAQTDWLLAENLNDLRTELGLGPPVKHVLRGYWYSPQRIVGLFPDWFAPPAPDWPAQTLLTRFPLLDAVETTPLPPLLQDFLEAGAPPLVFTAGSANPQAHRFFAVALQASQQLGARALFLTPFSSQIPEKLPASVGHFPYAPFSRLLPRCQAIVHPGGIGTAAQALAAGVPQLVVPLAFDQPDNAARIKRLGAGTYIYPRDYQPARVVEEVRELIRSKEVGRACRVCRDRLRDPMPRSDVIQLITDVA